MTFMVLTTIMPTFTAITFADDEQASNDVIEEAEETEETSNEDLEENPTDDVSLEEEVVPEEEPVVEPEETQEEFPEETPIEEPINEPEEVPTEVLEPEENEPEVLPEEEKTEEVTEDPSEMQEITEDVEEKPVYNYVPLYKVFTPIINSILAYPLSRSAVITYEFGAIDELHPSRHNGLDFAISMGTPIIAAESGTVIKAEYYGGYGNCVFIRHDNGIETRYAHMSEVNVKVGEEVVRGQQIGLVGSTGHSTTTRVIERMMTVKRI